MKLNVCIEILGWNIKIELDLLDYIVIHVWCLLCQISLKVFLQREKRKKKLIIVNNRNDNIRWDLKESKVLYGVKDCEIHFERPLRHLPTSSRIFRFRDNLKITKADLFYFFSRRRDSWIKRALFVESCYKHF